MRLLGVKVFGGKKSKAKEQNKEESNTLHSLIYIWGVSRKLATSVNQGDTILTIMDVLKCSQITLLKSY